MIFPLKPEEIDTLRWLKIPLMSFRRDHDQFLSKSQMPVAAKFEGKTETDRENVGVMCRSVKKKYDELETTRTT